MDIGLLIVLLLGTGEKGWERLGCRRRDECWEEFEKGRQHCFLSAEYCRRNAS
jgi:hypothetical protein